MLARLKAVSPVKSISKFVSSIRGGLSKANVSKVETKANATLKKFLKNLNKSHREKSVMELWKAFIKDFLHFRGLEKTSNLLEKIGGIKEIDPEDALKPLKKLFDGNAYQTLAQYWITLNAALFDPEYDEIISKSGNKIIHVYDVSEVPVWSTQSDIEKMRKKFGDSQDGSVRILPAEAPRIVRRSQQRRKSRKSPKAHTKARTKARKNKSRRSK